MEGATDFYVVEKRFPIDRVESVGNVDQHDLVFEYLPQ